MQAFTKGSQLNDAANFSILRLVGMIRIADTLSAMNCKFSCCYRDKYADRWLWEAKPRKGFMCACAALNVRYSVFSVTQSSRLSRSSVS